MSMFDGMTDGHEGKPPRPPQGKDGYSADFVPDPKLVDKLLNWLLTKSKGIVLTYDDISEVIGQNIKEDRGVYYAAKDRALNDHGMTFVNVYATGYKRAEDREIPGISSNARTGIRKKAAKHGKITATADMRNLNQTEQGEVIAHSTYFSIIAHASEEIKIEKLYKAVEKHDGSAPEDIRYNKALNVIKD